MLFASYQSRQRNVKAHRRQWSVAELPFGGAPCYSKPYYSPFIIAAISSCVELILYFPEKIILNNIIIESI
jgi:hypothetical protein